MKIKICYVIFRQTWQLQTRVQVSKNFKSHLGLGIKTLRGPQIVFRAKFGFLVNFIHQVLKWPNIFKGHLDPWSNILWALTNFWGQSAQGSTLFLTSGYKHKPYCWSPKSRAQRMMGRLRVNRHQPNNIVFTLSRPIIPCMRHFWWSAIKLMEKQNILKVRCENEDDIER